MDATVEQIDQALMDLWAGWDTTPSLLTFEFSTGPFQRYARWWNARHPGRRVSWRRLNRWQVEDAIYRFGSPQMKFALLAETLGLGHVRQ